MTQAKFVRLTKPRFDRINELLQEIETVKQSYLKRHQHLVGTRYKYKTNVTGFGRTQIRFRVVELTGFDVSSTGKIEPVYIEIKDGQKTHFRLFPDPQNLLQIGAVH